MHREEQTLQISTARYLETVLDPKLAWFTAIGHGGGGLTRGKILKAMGLKPGVPDILVCFKTHALMTDGHTLFIELKSKDGKVSEAQKQCHADLERVGATVYVCRNLNDVDLALVRAGVPMRVKR